MSAEVASYDLSAAFATRDNTGAAAIGRLRCSMSEHFLSDSSENVLLPTRHHFAHVREVQDGNRQIRGAFDGERSVSRQLCKQDSFFLPMGRRWVGISRGTGKVRQLVCDFDNSAIALALGDRIGSLKLEPRLGASPIASGILERLEAFCLAPDGVPRSYGDALSVVFVWELLRAYSTRPVLSPSTLNIGKSRFKPVLEHIEDTLDTDMSLSDLAAITGLSVSHFSHAFYAAYGVAPHRYILRRRIDKAKALLSNSFATILDISTRVGFSSQSRFAKTFSRHTGLTPSAYRSEQQR
jgi:AraC family transcriptional regulator